MPRFRSRSAGSILNVSDEVGRGLGDDFEPLDTPTPPAPDTDQDADKPAPQVESRRPRKR